MYPDIQQIEVDGLRIMYRQAGSGAPLVLLHGGMEDSRVWRRQFEGLSADFMVLAWDAPGCGQSSDIPETWRLAQFADALAAWLGALRVQRPHILGFSWGSAVALEFYRRYPGIPASLVLASAYAGWAGSLPAEEVTARLSGVLAAASTPRAESSELLAGVFSAAATPELLAEMRIITAGNDGSAHPGGLRAAAFSMAEADLREVLPQIHLPTLLIYGDLDERAPLTIAEAMHRQIPGSVLSVIHGAGHMANVEAPAAFNREIRQFLRGFNYRFLSART